MELKRQRRRPFINIVPLVDVLIVLIFFFLLTMQFRQASVLDITPPRMESAGRSEGFAALVLAVNLEGGYYINGRAVAPQELPDFFSEQAVLRPMPELLIAADEGVPLGAVTFVIDQARKAGLETVRLQAR